MLLIGGFARAVSVIASRNNKTINQAINGHGQQTNDQLGLVTDYSYGSKSRAVGPPSLSR